MYGTIRFTPIKIISKKGCTDNLISTENTNTLLK